MQPRYQALKEFIKDGISNGRWPAESCVPSENKLASEFNVSRMTANRALKELTEEGVLMRKQGLGTFVAESRPLASVLEIKNIADEIINRGHVYSSEVKVLEEIKANETQAIHMDCRQGAKLFYSLIIHKENDVPVQLEERFVSPQNAPDYLKQNFTQITPNKYLSVAAPLSTAEHIIEAMNIGENDAKFLQITENEACLLIHRTTWSAKQLVSYARLLHPGNRYRLASTINP